MTMMTAVNFTVVVVVVFVQRAVSLRTTVRQHVWIELILEATFRVLTHHEMPTRNASYRFAAEP